MGVEQEATHTYTHQKRVREFESPEKPDKEEGRRTKEEDG
jgi:hypothetical protein